MAYNLPLLIPLGKDGSAEKTKKALREILAKHPSLNVEFMMWDGEIVKRIIDQPLAFEVVKGLDRDTLVRPFELLDSRLYRFEYHETEKGDYLFCDFHHAIMDGFSLKRFLDEFALAYGGASLKAEAFDNLDDALAKHAAREDKASFEGHKKYFQDIFGAIDVDSSLTLDKQDAELLHHLP